MVPVVASERRYNFRSGGNDAENYASNPQTNAHTDMTAFETTSRTEAENLQPIAARGADNQPTQRDYAREDTETERSEQTLNVLKTRWTT
ncbi:unnamed protein product [Somion occarium]|uniref:Uncharacterized protein n=1 Tax=Somion occarium TaxID=3059160 RepID=A0ABP1ECF7_9APHY